MAKSILNMFSHVLKCKMNTYSFIARMEFRKALGHARVLSGLNPLTTTAIMDPQGVRNILVMDNKFDKFGIGT